MKERIFLSDPFTEAVCALLELAERLKGAKGAYRKKIEGKFKA